VRVRLASIAAALLLVAVLAWTGGLQHQANCIDAGKVGCSVWPWKSGHVTEQQRLVDRYGLDGFGP
jgi:hypothetical protein